MRNKKYQLQKKIKLIKNQLMDKKKRLLRIQHTTQEDPTTSDEKSSIPLDIDTISQAIAMRSKTTCNFVSRFQFLNTHRGIHYADETAQALNRFQLCSKLV